MTQQSQASSGRVRPIDTITVKPARPGLLPARGLILERAGDRAWGFYALTADGTLEWEGCADVLFHASSALHAALVAAARATTADGRPRTEVG